MKLVLILGVGSFLLKSGIKQHKIDNSANIVDSLELVLVVCPLLYLVKKVFSENSVVNRGV